jgi:hypothetical protein|tara:strand:+ start:913 stop:1227 length:315 start_codon:yes stop_codon:yes gene_type:complete
VDLDYGQLIVTIIGVLGTAGIWQFLSAKIKAKADAKRYHYENSDRVQYRDDLKDRVQNLEKLLSVSSDEKDELREQVLDLSKEVSALRIKVDFLEKENEILKRK